MAATLSVAGLAVAPQAALADMLAPDSPASSSADDMRTIYIVAVAVTLLAFAGILVALLGALRRGRGRSEASPRRTIGTRGIQGRVGIGLGVAMLALFVVGVVFAEKSSDAGASASGAEPIEIQATSQQWLWRYEYPAKVDSVDGFDPKEAYSYQDLVIPVDTPVTLNIGSTDVIHTWSVPALTRSVQATPGDETSVSFVADETGTFEGASRQFSGPAFPTMRTTVHVVEQEEYEAFLAERAEGINAARAAVQEQIDAGTAPGVQLEK